MSWKEAYRSVADSGLAKFVVIFFFFWNSPEDFLSRELGGFQMHWAWMDSVDAFFKFEFHREEMVKPEVLHPDLNLLNRTLQKIWSEFPNAGYWAVLLKPPLQTIPQPAKAWRCGWICEFFQNGIWKPVSFIWACRCCLHTRYGSVHVWLAVFFCCLLVNLWVR